MKAIDGEELLNKIYDCGFPDVDRNGRIDRSKVAEIINNMTTVESKKGKWIEHADRKHYRYGCNICGTLVNEKSPICPTCKAEMEVTDNDK